MANEHASLPVAIPSLEHLTNDELNALKGKFSATAKEARRRANQTLGRFPQLKKPWQRSLSVGKSTPDGDRAAVFAEFERELLRVPEAYVAHAYANSLILLEMSCRDEMLRRSMLPPMKKRSGPAPAVPSPAAEPEDLLPLDEALRVL